MEESLRFPSIIKIAVALTIVLSIILLAGYAVVTAQSSNQEIVDFPEARLSDQLSEDVLTALSQAYGNYEDLINMEVLIRDLASADIVLIGEAHHDQRDMLTAFELVRRLAKQRRIALAVERFPIPLQSRLDAIYRIEDVQRREDELSKIFRDEEYKTIWNPDSFNSPYLPNPSADEFEKMMVWAVRERVPIIALDLPLVEREFGLGEDFPYRNELWKNQIVDFLDQNYNLGYQVIVVGGIDHLDNSDGSVPAKIRDDRPHFKLSSIGQRDANYSTKIDLQVEKQGMAHQVDDLIIVEPQFSVVGHDGAPQFPTPPEYWIAVLSVE